MPAPVIYLDHNGSSRVSTRVVAAMVPYMTACYVNAAHPAAGWFGADQPRQAAADQVSRLLDCDADEIVFTSGATEANHAIMAMTAAGPRGRVVVSAIEHPSVQRGASRLAEHGFELVVVPVNQHGVVTPDALASALTPDTRLVSIMAANHETGVVQATPALAGVVADHAPQAIFHTDATQALGRIDITLGDAWENVHALSFSAHKFGGPKGVGGLFLRTGVPRTPWIAGGDQEHGLRAGTQNTPGLAGLAAAIGDLTVEDRAHMRDLQQRLERGLRARRPDVVIHGEAAPRLPNTTMCSFPGYTQRDLVERLAQAGVAVGRGSACTSGAMHPPTTLRAMGVPHDLAWTAIRISTAPSTAPADIDGLLQHLDALLQTAAPTVLVR